MKVHAELKKKKSFYFKIMPLKLICKIMEQEFTIRRSVTCTTAKQINDRIIMQYRWASTPHVPLILGIMPVCLGVSGC